MSNVQRELIFSAERKRINASTLPDADNAAVGNGRTELIFKTVSFLCRKRGCFFVPKTLLEN